MTLYAKIYVKMLTKFFFFGFQIGKRGHYELGKWLRARYNNLLSEEYKRDDIYVRSTDVDRTLMSAYSNLAGLYEPSKKKNWNENILWTPIPVHTLPENMDNVRSHY